MDIMDYDLVSVIVPIFQVEDYVIRCLKSILNSTYSNIEILCVNDCTIDNSITLVKELQKDNSKIKLIDYEYNRGLGGARNAGIDSAHGKYIIFVDSDDAIDCRMIELLVSSLKFADAAICSINSRSDRTGEIWYHSTFIEQPDNSYIYDISKDKSILINLWPSAWNKIYRTDIIKKNRIRYKERLLYEDHTFFYEYFSHIRSFVYIKEPLYYYTNDRAGSITNTLTGREAEIFQVLNYLEDIFKDIFGNIYEYYLRKISLRLLWERKFVFEQTSEAFFEYHNIVKKYFDSKNWKAADLIEVKDSNIDVNDSIITFLFDTRPDDSMNYNSENERFVKDKQTMHTIIKKIKRKTPFIRKIYILHDNLVAIRQVVENLLAQQNDISNRVHNLENTFYTMDGRQNYRDAKDDEFKNYYNGLLLSSVKKVSQEQADRLEIIMNASEELEKQIKELYAWTHNNNRITEEIKESSFYLQKKLKQVAGIVCCEYKPDVSIDGEIYSTNIQKQMWIYAGITSAQFAMKELGMARACNDCYELLEYSLKLRPQDGLILEFGVFSGKTINFIADHVQNETVYGFDSFEGLPEDWRNGYEKGQFSKDDLPNVNENVNLIKGWFSESLPDFISQHKETVSFVHVDCDLYSSTKTIFNSINTFTSGTIIVFDEFFNYPGWEENEYLAFKEFIENSCWNYKCIGFVPSHQQVAIQLIARK